MLTTRPKEGLRLVVGIDGTTASGYALDLARRLDFRVPQHYVLVNAVEPIVLAGQGLPLAREQRAREAAGIAMLKRALPQIADRDSKAEELQAHGEPSQVLCRIAQEEKADIVVVGHNRRNVIEDRIMGSVARSLLRDCPQHVLVARPQPNAPGKLVAIIATDDSPESGRCIDAFLHLAPIGLDKVIVLTVNEVDSGAAAMLVRGLPHLQKKAEQWVSEGLLTDARALCVRLEAAGFAAEALVVEGSDKGLAISQACEAARASLLIVAARPHGFWDRLIHGSVSEEILQKNARSLLVLRP